MSSNMESVPKNQEFYLETDGGESSEKPGTETINEKEENENEEDVTVTTPMLNGRTENAGKILYQVGDVEVEVVSDIYFLSSHD